MSNINITSTLTWKRIDSGFYISSCGRFNAETEWRRTEGESNSRDWVLCCNKTHELISLHLTFRDCKIDAQMIVNN